MPIQVTLITDDEEEDETPTIATNALAPKRVSIDGETVEQHPIADQILADRYTRSQAAGAVGIGVVYRKFVSPGSV